jgi:glyceraldehyde 3-phosphate dehydrogenase
MGRNIFRLIYRRHDMEVVAINELADSKALAYLLRFDSLHGRFEEPVELLGQTLYAKGKKIPILDQKEPGDVPWFDYGVDVVIDATGRYRTRAELQRHLDAGADRVVITTPPLDEIDKIYFHGVEREPISRRHRIISCGSSTSGATMLMLKVLDDAFGVDSAFFTSVHAYTNEQNLIDVPSSVDLVSTLKTRAGIEDVNAVFSSAANSTMKGFLEFTDDPIVSSDVAGSSASCTLDSLQTMQVDGAMIKTLGWYEQGGGHSHRIVDLIAGLAHPKVEATSS